MWSQLPGVDKMFSFWCKSCRMLFILLAIVLKLSFLDHDPKLVKFRWKRLGGRWELPFIVEGLVVENGSSDSGTVGRWIGIVGSNHNSQLGLDSRNQFAVQSDNCQISNSFILKVRDWWGLTARLRPSCDNCTYCRGPCSWRSFEPPRAHASPQRTIAQMQHLFPDRRSKILGKRRQRRGTAS